MNPLYKTTKKPSDFISSHAKGVADMITLNNLTEESLLDNIHTRFSEEIIYVCGINYPSCLILMFVSDIYGINLGCRYAYLPLHNSSIKLTVVLVNPYREIDIYNPDIANLYSTAQDKTALPPHVFAGIHLIPLSFILILFYFAYCTQLLIMHM